MPVRSATAFAPASVGNVGPGFDVLGLAVDGLGDSVSVTLIDGPGRIDSVTGRDADRVPHDAATNLAAMAAVEWLRAHDDARNPVVSIHKGLPLAGGLGGSAASSVAGAYAAALAAGAQPRAEEIIAAALNAESKVTGRHLDNISPSVLGGLTLSRALDPIDVVRLPVANPWWVVLLSPLAQILTKEARSILPETWPRSEWVQQMANTAAVVHAFAVGDGALLRRALDDRYAEPLRAPLIPRFHEVKRAALDAGALGCSISGSGPAIFAIAASEGSAQTCLKAMRNAAGPDVTMEHAGPIAREGVRAA